MLVKYTLKRNIRRKEGAGYAKQNVELFGKLLFKSQTQKKDNENGTALLFGGVYSFRYRGGNNDIYHSPKAKRQ